MLKIKHTLRRLSQYSRVSTISVCGFAISFVLLILIANYVIPILTVDSYHKNRERIAIVSTEYLGYDIRMPNLDYKMIEAAKTCPLIEAITPFCQAYQAEISLDGKRYHHIDAASVDSSFFSIFSFEFLVGRRTNCLEKPFTAIITESRARELFGNSNPLGKELVIREHAKEQTFVIEGVIKDYPSNSIFNTELFLSYETKKVIESDRYGDNAKRGASEMPFVLLREGVEYPELTAYFSDLILEKEGKTMVASPQLHSLKDFYFDEMINEIYFNRADINKVYIMIALGLLVLVLSVTNYINFLLSIVVLRAKSNSTLRVFGHSFKHFFMNYWGDTLVLMMSGFLLAVIIYSFIIYPYSSTNYELFNCLGNSMYVSVVVVLVLVLASMVAALVGAFLSNKQDVVKRYEVHTKGLFLSNGMLVFQFAIVVFLFICGSALNKQLHFLQEKNPSFNSENIIYINDYFEGGISKADKETILKIPGVTNAGFSNWIPGRVATLTKYKETHILTGEEVEFSGPQINIDNNAFKMLGFELVAGRALLDSESQKQNLLLVNEAYMKKANLNYHSTERFNADNTIVGVVKDFHIFSKKEVIEPLTIYLADEETELYQLLIELEVGFQNQKRVIQEIEKMWNSKNKVYPMKWQYLNERINSLYRTEYEFTYIILWLTLFAFITSLLGLIGMVVFMLSNKTKEIGIRKVNGGNVFDILRFINSRFLHLVLWGYLLGSPLAWWYMTIWLKNFAYKIQLSWWIFALAGMCVLLAVIVTVSLQSWSTASKNPVETLRYE